MAVCVCKRGHSCDKAKQEMFVMATSCLIVLFLMKCFYVQLVDPYPCVVSARRLLGLSPNTLNRKALYTEVMYYNDTHVKVKCTLCYSGKHNVKEDMMPIL